MPYEVKRTKNGWGVQNTETGDWKSRDTTREKAQGQINLLRAKEHNPKWKPTGKRAWRRKRGHG